MYISIRKGDFPRKCNFLTFFLNLFITSQAWSLPCWKNLPYRYHLFTDPTSPSSFDSGQTAWKIESISNSFSTHLSDLLHESPCFEFLIWFHKINFKDFSGKYWQMHLKELYYFLQKYCNLRDWTVVMEQWVWKYLWLDSILFDILMIFLIQLLFFKHLDFLGRKY